MTPSLSPEGSAQAHVNRRAVVAGNTAFALDLYHQLRGQPGNLFFSPFSLSCALAMTYAGARAETARQMAKALHFTLPEEQLHPAFADLQACLNTAHRSEAIFLLMANALWPAIGLSLRPEFLDRLEWNYAARVSPLDYAQTDDARLTINKWASDLTQNTVGELIAPGVLGPETALALANACCFTGQWAFPFDPQDTQLQPFYLNSTDQVKAPMMYRKFEGCCYHGDALVELVELPYAGGQLSMVVLLPKKVDGLAALENALTVPRLAEWIGELTGRTLEVWLPKFGAASQFALEAKLKALGILDAFGDAADFSGMFQQRGPFLSAVVHTAVVKVHELGTEARAVSGVVYTLCWGPGEFHADHPFLFLIRDRSTGSILFLGRITDPNESGPP